MGVTLDNTGFNIRFLLNKRLIFKGNIMKRITTVSLMLAAAFASTTAQAKVESYAILGPVTVQLIDLDLNDGITPFLTPTGLDARVYGHAGDTAAVNFQNYDFSLPSTLTGSVSTAISQGNSSIIGTDPTNATQNSSGSAMGPTASPGNQGNYQGASYVYGYFSLSANTQAIFSANASTSASSNAPFTLSNVDDESAFAQSYLQGVLSGSIVDQDFIYSQGYNYGSLVDKSNSQTRTLQVTINNASANALAGYLFGQTLTNGNSYSNYIAAVPEPETYAMLFVGLVLVGFSAKRKKQAVI